MAKALKEAVPAKERTSKVVGQRRPLPNNDKDLLTQCALFDVHRLSRLLTGMYNSYLRDTGLTMAQFTLLRNIDVLAPAGMKQIAHAMLMDRTSVTRLIDPLIKQGFLTDSVGEDRRFRNIIVTAKGQSAIAKSEGAWTLAQQELFKCIGSEQWRSLRTALRDTIHVVRDNHEDILQ